MNMRNILFASLIAVANCSKKENPILQVFPQNKVVLLKVNFVDYYFEGAQTLTVSSPFVFNNSLPITTEFMPPIDFGHIKMFYQTNNDSIFNGVMIAIGTGAIQFPNFLPPSHFISLKDSIEVPDTSRFQGLFNLQDTYPYEYAKVWDAIDKLQITNQYIGSPKKIGLCLYAPSVWPAVHQEWSWIVVMNAELI